MKYPAITLMTDSSQGKVFQAAGCLYDRHLVFMLFALVTVFLFYAQELVEKLRKKDTHKKWYLCGMKLAVFGVEK